MQLLARLQVTAHQTEKLVYILVRMPCNQRLERSTADSPSGDHECKVLQDSSGLYLFRTIVALQHHFVVPQVEALQRQGVQHMRHDLARPRRTFDDRLLCEIDGH